jgi:membrane AbrB-like protein
MRLATLGIAFAGGAVLNLTNLPLAWFLGALISVALCSGFSKGLSVPTSWRLSGTALLGTIVGALVNSDILQLLLNYAPSIGMMLCSQLLLVMAGTSFFLRRNSTDRLSALLAAYPGSISQIIALSLENKCDSQFVAINHTVRIFSVIAFIPLIIALITNGIDVEAVVTKDPDNNFVSYAWPILVAALGFILGKCCKLISPALFGPMMLAAFLSIAGLLPDTGIGPWLMPLAQIIIGASVGLRFQGMGLHEWKRVKSIHLPYGLVLLVFTLLASWVTHQLLGIPLNTSLLIMAPGGLSEMVLIAYSLDIDPVMVTSHHVIRSLFGFLAIPWMMRLWLRL